MSFRLTPRLKDGFSKCFKRPRETPTLPFLSQKGLLCNGILERARLIRDRLITMEKMLLLAPESAIHRRRNPEEGFRSLSFLKELPLPMETVPGSRTGPVPSLSTHGIPRSGLVWSWIYPPAPPPPWSPSASSFAALSTSFSLRRVVHCTDVEMRVRLVDADYERIRKLHCPRANTKS